MDFKEDPDTGFVTITASAEEWEWLQEMLERPQTDKPRLRALLQANPLDPDADLPESNPQSNPFDSGADS